jgi:serine/threonine protein kinase
MTADRVIGNGPSVPDGRDAAAGAVEGQNRLVGRRYRLMSPVGRGGMGMVWHAHDVLLDRDVAVKELILPFGLDHAGKQVAHRRMLREARSAARLSHPGIVTVHDVVEEDGRPWIVMELVRAWSLEQAVRESGPLPVVQAAEIGIRVLDALRHAHAAGILHRDVKPGNVLLTADRVVLTDFGIAAIEGDVTITQTGLLMGSPAYIPPERLQGKSITQAADLWSFGATLYAAVEGRPPYEGPDAVAVLGAVLTQEPSRPQRAGALLPIIEGLLRKNPGDRMPAAQVSDLLEHVLQSHGSATGSHTPSRPAAPMPTAADSMPIQLLPPLDPPSGPMPSRIVETPSGPVRVPYEPVTELGAGYPATHDVLPMPAAGNAQQDPFDAMSGAPSVRVPGFGPLGEQAPAPYDALSSPAGAQPNPFAPPRDPLGGPAGGHGDPFGNPSGPQQEPSSQYGPFHGPPPPDDAFRRPTGSKRGYDALNSPSTPLPPEFQKLATQPTPKETPARITSGAVGAFEALRGQTGETRVSSRPRSELDERRAESARNAKRRAGGGTGGAGGRLGGGRPAPRLLLAAAGAAAAVILVVLLLRSGSPDDPAPVAPAAPSAVAEEQTSQDSGERGNDLPEGFTTRSQNGIAAAVPEGWRVSGAGNRVSFTGPSNTGETITVDKVAPASDGGLAALGRAREGAELAEYIQVQLQRVSYRQWKASDWEYTHTLENGVPMHTLVRHVTVSAQQGYRITFVTPDLQWDDSSEMRAVFLTNFSPDAD